MWRRRDVPFRIIDGEAVVLPVRRQVADLTRVVWLNRVAAWIWIRLEGAAGTDALVDAVLGRFRVDRARACADLGRFLDRMAALDLVERVGDEPRTTRTSSIG